MDETLAPWAAPLRRRCRPLTMPCAVSHARAEAIQPPSPQCNLPLAQHALNAPVHGGAVHACRRATSETLPWHCASNCASASGRFASRGGVGRAQGGVAGVSWASPAAADCSASGRCDKAMTCALLVRRIGARGTAPPRSAARCSTRAGCRPAVRKQGRACRLFEVVAA